MPEDDDALPPDPTLVTDLRDAATTIEESAQPPKLVRSYSQLDQLEVREAFARLDSAVWSKAHLRTILVCGVGFLGDAYDNTVISLMVPMIAYAYLGPESNGALSPAADGTLKAASSYGNLFGQLGFGMLADCLGRKRIYGIELIVLMVGAMASAMVGTTKSGGFTAFLFLLGFWRFVLGLGVGGDYPVSAVITSEFASVSKRGTIIATVFAMQGAGILVAALVAVATLAGSKSAIEANLDYLDTTWRILAAFGVVPALAATYYRLTIPETPRFSADVLGDAEKAHRDVKRYLSENGHPTGVLVDLIHNNEGKSRTSTVVEEHVRTRRKLKHKYFNELFEYLAVPKNRVTLLGTAGCWFFLDIAFYGCILNTPVVLQAIGFADSSTPYNDIWSRAVGNVIIALAGSLPGYVVTILLVDRWGRKKIQFIGFAMLVVCFTILAAAYDKLVSNAKWAFVLVYAVAQFFFNFGPNATTFIIPAECFPTRVRSTCHGISAASGKLGAILAAQCFSLLANIGGPNAWLPNLMWIFTGCMLLGLLLTFLVPETMGKSLEELGSDGREVDGSEPDPDVTETA